MQQGMLGATVVADVTVKLIGYLQRRRAVRAFESYESDVVHITQYLIKSTTT